MPAALIALITASPWQPVRTTSQIPPVVYSVYQSLHPVATTSMEKNKNKQKKPLLISVKGNLQRLK